MTLRQKSEDLKYGDIVGRLLKRIGYSHDALIVDGNLLVKMVWHMTVLRLSQENHL